MKTKFLTVSFLFITMTIISCNKTPTDYIQLSQRQATFNQKGDSIIIIAKNKWAGYNGIYLNSTMLKIDYWSDPCNLKYIDSNTQIVSKSCDTLFIKMNENNSYSIRKLTIGLMVGDYGDIISITQNSK